MRETLLTKHTNSNKSDEDTSRLRTYDWCVWL